MQLRQEECFLYDQEAKLGSSTGIYLPSLSFNHAAIWKDIGKRSPRLYMIEINEKFCYDRWHVNIRCISAV